MFTVPVHDPQTITVGPQDPVLVSFCQTDTNLHISLGRGNCQPRNCLYQMTYECVVLSPASLWGAQTLLQWEEAGQSSKLAVHTGSRSPLWVPRCCCYTTRKGSQEPGSTMIFTLGASTRQAGRGRWSPGRTGASPVRSEG